MADQNELTAAVTPPEDSNQTPAQFEKGKEKVWTATLKRGKRYVCLGIHFLHNEGTDVSEDLKRYLEDKAVDVRNVEGELDEDGAPLKEERAKFAFRKVGTEKPASKAEPRHRRAPPA